MAGYCSSSGNRAIASLKNSRQSPWSLPTPFRRNRTIESCAGFASRLGMSDHGRGNALGSCGVALPKEIRYCQGKETVTHAQPSRLGDELHAPRVLVDGRAFRCTNKPFPAGKQVEHQRFVMGPSCRSLHNGSVQGADRELQGFSGIQKFLTEGCQKSLALFAGRVDRDVENVPNRRINPIQPRLLPVIVDRCMFPRWTDARCRAINLGDSSFGRGLNATCVCRLLRDSGLDTELVEGVSCRLCRGRRNGDLRLWFGLIGYLARARGRLLRRGGFGARRGGRPQLFEPAESYLREGNGQYRRDAGRRTGCVIDSY